MNQTFHYRLDVTAIEEMRDEKGWSVTTFCERASISRPTWYKIVSDGGVTSMENVAKIAHGLGVHPWDISKAEGFPDPLMGAPADMAQGIMPA